nr:glutamine synthetase [Eubacterium sp.]
WGPYDFNLYKLTEEEKAKLTGLPSSLDEAIAELEKDHDYLTAGGVFPERLIQQIIERNKAAAKKVSKLPHPMEFALYYDL